MTQPRKAIQPATLLKRNGRRIPFDPGEIERTIAAAGQATGEFNPQQAQTSAEHVVEHLPEHACLNIRRVWGLIEQVLIEASHYPTVRVHTVYRERHDRPRRERKALVDIAASINEYLSCEDWRVRANANRGYSLGEPTLNVPGKVTTSYWLDRICDVDIAIVHCDVDLYIHNLDMLIGYCAGWSLHTLLNEGPNGMPGRVEAGSPKYLDSASEQVINSLGTLQNKWVGTQASNSSGTCLAPCVRKDCLDYASVRQVLQEFVYDLNVPSCWSTRTPFTSPTFDWACPDDLHDQVPRTGGKGMPFAYGELQTEVDLANRVYIKAMQADDAHGWVFTFPIPIYNTTHDSPWDSDNATRLFETTVRYGPSYLQDFLNSDMQSNQVRSMRCHLQLDVRELLKRGNGLFGSVGQAGSLDVVTINCMRLGYRHRGDATDPYRRPDHLLESASANLEPKRKAIQQHMNAGLYPCTRRYLDILRDHFSTIGVNGLHEIVRNFNGDCEGLHNEAGREIALALLDYVRARLVTFQEDSGHLYNLEATLAEGATYRFAREDRKRCSRILQAGTPGVPYYTNSSQLPVGFTDDPFEALELQDALQCKYTDGTVLHLYMTERISSAETCKILVRTVFGRLHLPYLIVTPTFSICPRHGYLVGEYESCSKYNRELLQRSTPKSCCGGYSG